MNLFLNRSPIAVAALALLAIQPMTPAIGQAVSRISFPAGNDNTSVKGSVTGKQYRDYKLKVGAGQTLAVALTTKGSAYFNILPPGSKDVAVYNSSMDGQSATGIKTKAGDYTIRVYNMGTAEQSKKPTSYLLSVTVM